MSKQIKPVRGKPVAEYLAGWLDEYPAGDIHEEIHILKDYVNPGICLNELQVENLDFYFKEQRIHYPWIPVLINSFRLDCQNCLNARCEMRDPEKPIEDVLGKMNASEKPTKKAFNILDLNLPRRADAVIRSVIMDKVRAVGERIEWDDVNQFTVERICGLTEEELLAQVDCGPTHLKNIERALAEFGMKLKQD